MLFNFKARVVLSCVLATLILIVARSWVRAVPLSRATNTYKVIGWNDLGMHCMDDDYSVFSILPPYNNIHAQVVGPDGKLVRSGTGISVTYQAVADADGSINTSSRGKTSFWTYVQALYGASPAPDVGLKGNAMPGSGNVPRGMTFDGGLAQFVAEGVPITPYDDAQRKNTYPMMRLAARDASGNLLATTDIVLPVSDEMDCRLCHASSSGPAARPSAGWVNNADAAKDYRLNILRLHDDKFLGDSSFQNAAAIAGYDAAGLYAQASSGSPILCAKCHASNALPGTGIAGINPLTTVVHGRHATVIDPTTNQTLDASTNRAACYRCHPGSTTKCLRGAMGNALAADGTALMQCQSCHGSMSAVGAETRRGWLNEPTCQNCHTGTAIKNNGQIRYASVFESNGQPRQASDMTFATTPNVPGAGLSLFRFSTGHGGLLCEACHGSTHAEFPSSHRNDNVQSVALQGHSGVLIECSACHSSSTSATGGPHGMHPVGQDWVGAHGDSAEHSTAGCQGCHGADYTGTVLSQAHADRTFTAFGTRTFSTGTQIGCYSCHNGPGSEKGVDTGDAQKKLSDLTGVWISLSQLVKTNRTGTLYTLKGTFTVKNIGVGKSGACSVALFLSPDPILHMTDTARALKVLRVGAMKPGASKKLKLNIRLLKGSGSAIGQYLIARVDSLNKVLEASKSNNIIASPPIQ